MTKMPAGHPDQEHLLRYADGELSARRSKRIRAHLEACWECRTGFAELQRCIEDCVAYRKAALQVLPEPPLPWKDIYGRFAQADESLAARPWRLRVWETVRAGAMRPRRWAAAAALAATVWAVVDQLPRFRGPQPAPPPPKMAAPLPERPIGPAEPLPQPRRTAMRRPPPERLPVEEATPGDELRVFAVLHRLGADLGEPVEVKRGRERVLVTGVGIDPRRRYEIGEALRTLPRVSVNFSEPAAVQPPGDRATRQISANPEVSRLPADLQRYFGGRAAVEEFTNRILETSDELLSRAHALRRLAERFPADTEAALTGVERQTLQGLRREHAAVLARLAADLERNTAPALHALGATAQPGLPPPAGSWQLATEGLFQRAREAEGALAALLAGAAAPQSPDALPGRVLASVASLRAAAEAYVNLE